MATCINGVLAAKESRGPVPWIVVQEGSTSSHFIEKRSQPSTCLSRIFEVLTPHGQGNSVSRRHNDAGRPDLHVQFIYLSGRKRLQYIVSVVRPVLGAHFSVKLPVRGPEPTLANRRVWVMRSLENHLAPVRSEHTEDHKNVCVVR